MTNKLDNLNLVQVRELLANGQATAVELTQHYLNRIAEANLELNAFITINDQALEQARGVDQKIAETGQVDFLEGVPVAIKDTIVTKDLRTTAGSQILDNYLPPYSATVINKLENHNAVILGKTNCDEFAMGSSNENSSYGAVKNPHDISKVPGGSSGGSAAAVAADLCVYALGTDTGGSIRQPASFCGVVGLKPTYGRVSRNGLIAMASSFDQIGPITKTVEDVAIIMEAIAGQCPYDATSLGAVVPNYSKMIKEDIVGMRVALPKQYLSADLPKQIRDRMLVSIEKLTDKGVNIEEVDVPLLERALAIYYTIMPAEVSANLARFDGIRYGNVVEAEELWQVYKQTRGQRFGAEVKRRILIGTYVLSAGYYDAYYKKALQVQKMLKAELNDIWQEYDAIISPTTPTTAFELGDKTSDPLTMYLSDIYTVVANIVGSPAISIPVGKDQDSLPIGLQLMGEPLAEGKIMKLAWHLENYRG
ncbi:MAG: aspartyl/glutamyl-tRNA amidotransferase subunit A [Parcubacteria group bacterium CG1_02_37_51]|uniref:Glutamyl-tRNA(Gln) amidotransferase subunit A n=2 Tax=Candidatus Komeiliibacteriota TaxID=1817908 RepID=A0A2M7REK8_9BACT|nr:MAG: aspartyl/glutamyl-tRNA amidotransferase subunit A [Parcubacteria group bacterium CG1_02_37_51]PIY95178.1 MAG: Asp-tRNA(Asn)/Glu-tRNA(Gln) amidotransferase GatCAB subunit A [Candidatus Komeilibacteria bacterium CG_4_10_14_0_8_um_filter_37_78]